MAASWAWDRVASGADTGYNGSTSPARPEGRERESVDEARILLIEDDPDIREGVRLLLESEGYFVDEAADGETGLALVGEDTDLVILDIMMPGMSGLKVCQELRRSSNVPVLFLTARAQESDKLIGLMAGGDDYLTKPFSYTELMVRTRALLRRYRIYRGKGVSPVREQPTQLNAGGIRLSTVGNQVWVDGKEVRLSGLEYRLLRLLMEYPGTIFSAQTLYERVWEEPYFYSCGSTVMVHVRKLRLKVERDPQRPKRIVTEWGKGYRFEAVE
ncbi:MAG TPA: response regulator transcription factor [Candidatus Intestinimonas merdavium]|uniref:Stage 0 sporulation protein A homolog n=1 Tax=Candidatus Intestinimonas merdavium TaxID=2838622 RepID=A0A9D1Z2V2_9FIRM|nr:response regulator transcription factor [Candidatus Intestinimonas merdavium]